MDLRLPLSNNEMRISYRFGFMGIGMGGTSIAAACSDITTDIINNRHPYSALLINTNQNDLDKVVSTNPNNTKLLIGSGKGAGRDIEIGERLFLKYENEIENAVINQFTNTDFVWLVVGLGGGTGTGSVIRAIGTLMKNGFNKKFGLILTLPRVADGHTVINNALQRLSMIYSAMGKLGPIILVDNQKLFDEYCETNPKANVKEYLTYSNNYIAEILHELNVVTASYLPYGDNHFDSSEFGKVLRTPGVIHFARFKAKPNEIDVEQVLSYSTKLKAEIENGVLSSGYDLSKSFHSAISVLASSVDSKRLFTLEFQRQLEELLENVSASASQKPVSMYEYKASNSPKTVYFYSVFSGLDLPHNRIKELREKENELALAEQASTLTINNDLFAGISKTSSKNDDEVSFEDLFGLNNEEKQEENKNKSVDSILDELGL